MDPFPRAKLMKLGYLILDKVKACPEDSIYRLLTEEKIKWIMQKVDSIEDIKELEKVISAGDAIEITIQELNNEYHMIDQVLVMKPWETDKEYVGMTDVFRTEMPYDQYSRENRPTIHEAASGLEITPNTLQNTSTTEILISDTIAFDSAIRILPYSARRPFAGHIIKTQN